MAAKFAEAVVADAQALAAVLLADGELVATKLEQDTAGFLENLAAGDADGPAFWQRAADAATEALVELQEPALAQLDALETDGLAALDQLEASLVDQLDLMEGSIGSAIELAAFDAVDAFVWQVDDFLVALDDQIATLEERVSVCHESQWPLLTELLDEAREGLPEGGADAVAASLDEALAAIAAMPEAVAAELDAAALDIETSLTDLLDQIAGVATEVVDGVDVSTEEALASLDTEWGATAEEQCARLDAAYEEATTGEHGLETTYDAAFVGEGGIHTKRDGGFEEIDELFTATQGDLCEKAAALSGKPQEHDWTRSVTGFWDGAWDHFRSNGVTLILVIVAVVVVIAIAAAIVFFFPESAIAAAILALVALIAEYGAVLATAGKWLTALSLALAGLAVLKGLLDPRLTSYERGEALGGGAVDIAFELVPDALVDAALVRKMAQAADAPSDAATSLAKVDEALGGATRSADLGAAADHASDAAVAAGQHDALAGLAGDAGALADDLDGTAGSLRQAEAAASQLDEVGTVDEVGDAARRLSEAPTGAVDDVPLVTPAEVAAVKADWDSALAQVSGAQDGWDDAAMTLSRLESELEAASRSADEAIAYAQRELATAEQQLSSFERLAEGSAKWLATAQEALDSVPNGEIDALQAAYRELSQATTAHITSVEKLADAQVAAAHAREALGKARSAGEQTVGWLTSQVKAARGALDGAQDTLDMHRTTADRLESVWQTYRRHLEEAAAPAPGPPERSPDLDDIEFEIDLDDLLTWRSAYDQLTTSYWTAKYGSKEARTGAPAFAVGYGVTKSGAASAYQNATGAADQAVDTVALAEHLGADQEPTVTAGADVADRIDALEGVCPVD
jgi:hypothetical protein